MPGNSCTAAEYIDAVAVFEQAAARLAAVDPVMLSSQQVLVALEHLEKSIRQVSFGQNLLAKVAEEQAIPSQLGYTGLKELLVKRLRLSGAEARDRVHGARDRAPRHERGFDPEPLRPLATAAQRSGAISERHALAIDRIFSKCRRTLTPDEALVLEDILTTAAHDVTPDDLAMIGKRAIDLLDPDGAEPDHTVIDRARDLNIARQDDDLMTTIDGALSPEGRALLDVIIDKFARPGVNNPADADNPVDAADQTALAQAAQRDTRTVGQRNHDALVFALRMAVTAGESGNGLGHHRGLPCAPIITLRIDQLEAELGIATTATGGRLPVATALQMMGTNPKYILLTSLTERPLYLGREKRLATVDQRIALYGTDTGCTAPGCDSSATRCQVHHIANWAAGGCTDIDNLTLACDAHHGKVSDDGSGLGWHTSTVAGDRLHAGRTGWQRTTHPDATVEVNHRHHPAELYRIAIDNWRIRRQNMINLWRSEDLRHQYDEVIGDTYRTISGILDGPNGPPILERLLAEHDDDNHWCAPAAPAQRAA